MTHILEYMPAWCFWQIFLPIGFFDFTDKHKTEIAIVRDYKDKPWISWFIMFVFYVNWYRKIRITKYLSQGSLNYCMYTSIWSEKSHLKDSSSKFNLIQVREYERKRISWCLIGQELLSTDTGKLKKKKNTSIWKEGKPTL